jgi:molecular chaperone GrpE (heat shock protein)
LVGPWSNLAALTAMVEAGQEVAPADLTVLVRSLEKELTRAGLTAIGQVGAQTVFDVACHQRMSGGTVQAGTPVTVQIPGYHFGSKVLMKALVSAPADGRESQEPNDDESGT